VDAESLLTLVPVAASSLTYATMMAICSWGILRARRARPAPPKATPRISILKPLAGGDDELEANLASFASLEYPDYEILFGLASRDDGALPIAQEFVRAHPELARIVFTDPDNAVNPKVAQLIDLEREATGEVIVISDSNVRVERHYLWSLMRELEVPGAGLVTSIFVGSGEQTMASALENLQLCAMTAPSIVATNMVTKWQATIGKSMAMRRSDLAGLGGLAPFGGLLAEDQALGAAFAQAGLGVRTSLDVVHNRNVTCTLRRTLQRHTRWSKLRRSLSPAGFVFEPLLTPVVMATLVAVIAHSQLALAALGIVAVAQTITALAMTALLRGHGIAWRYAPLEIVRVYLQLVCWAVALTSMRIQWRGHPFLLKHRSVIVPAPPSAIAAMWARVRSGAARASRA
jgi:ceramide glucosyltransferase